ncbi:dehydrodolichyl diphosphate synthase complex subunit DHDDS [Cylas formicarius]|uniref:dehydrodolichyl diphosphate synthase complex subunit DHDDS n=1 Tax=Cylas formicarius TaxID=197179 RepID=UPI0029584F74|nr:dehydrodolichyl diphosphate synthase complex subunit DHDDS [Cylas formicarius]
MPWVAETPLSRLQQFCINVLRCGPVPRHVAFIMDGNRRYAKKVHLEKVEGHSKGFEKLSECLRWCLEIGVKEATVYAFSIENFKRSSEEVNGLMQLAREKFAKVFQDSERLEKEGICIKVIGNLSLLPRDLQNLIAKAMLLTMNNKKLVINVAFAYTSTDEIANSVKSVIQGVNNNELSVDDINEELLSKCLYTSDGTNPDLLIRTSGEVRLSDFLLWQSSNTTIYFAEVLWPEFTFYHLMAAVFKYQRSYSDRVRFLTHTEKVKESYNGRVQSFLEKLRQRRISELKVYAS